jgi:hypothetical protein
MSSMTICLIAFACIVGGTILGMILRAMLPGHHLSPDSKDVVKLGMGLIGTMTALVLGLLIASAKSSFDTQRNGVAQLAGEVIFLDRTLARYGKETKDLRAKLKASLADMIDRTWPQESAEPGSPDGSTQTEGRYEGVYDQIEALAPKNAAQGTLKAQAVKIATHIGQQRWLLFAQKGSSIPTPFLVVMVFWLALIMASFGLFAPPNATAFLTLMVCALAVASAIFLILELDHPFNGIIQISSAPLRTALAQLGR